MMKDRISNMYSKYTTSYCNHVSFMIPKDVANIFVLAYHTINLILSSLVKCLLHYRDNKVL